MPAAVPIIMGQNIGTCVTALLSSLGTDKNAKRAAVVHLSFKVIGTVVWLSVFSIISAVFQPAILDASGFLPRDRHRTLSVQCPLYHSSASDVIAAGKAGL